MTQPLYKKIFIDLKTAISDGSLPIDSQVPTEKELSQKYEVSRITSKRALTELEQLGLIYRVRGKGSFVKAAPEESPQKIKTGIKKVLFLLPFLSNISIGEFTKGLNPLMQEKKIDVLMTPLDFLQKKTAQEIINEFDGMIFYAVDTQNYLDLLFELSLKHFPVVILDKKIYELPFPTVLSDNFEAGIIATNHLIQAGHKKIAYLFGEKIHPQSVRQRYLGYLEALDKAELAFHTSLDENNSTSEELFSYIDRHQVTAFICEDDLVAIQTMNQLKAQGYLIPDDFSIIGFDDIQAASLVEPPLTTIAQDFQQLGTIVATNLISWIETHEIPADTKLPVSFIKRSSTMDIS